MVPECGVRDLFVLMVCDRPVTFRTNLPLLIESIDGSHDYSCELETATTAVTYATEQGNRWENYANQHARSANRQESVTNEVHSQHQRPPRAKLHFLSLAIIICRNARHIW